jgi:hypothetical protein
MELLYTLRGVDDAELQRRITATLPTLQEIIAACEARAAQRTAERETTQASQTASTPADLEARIQQAVQEALVAQATRQGTAAAHGTAASTPPAPPSTPPEAPAGDDQETGFCSLHEVDMKAHTDLKTRDTWYSHWDKEEQCYCRGRSPRRRTRSHRR